MIHSNLLGLTIGVMLLMTACVSDEKNPIPYYLIPDSSLDSPGAAAARKTELLRRAKEGGFRNGATVKVSQGKTFFFAANPEIDGGQEGKMMKADDVKIVTCEGLYYYVKTPNGDGGYVRESDLIDPAAMLVPTMDGEMDETVGTWASSSLQGPVIRSSEMGLFPPEGVVDGFSLTKNANGRVVNLVRKDTEAGEQFEWQKKKFNASTTSDIDPNLAPADEIPDLPESAANKQKSR